MKKIKFKTLFEYLFIFLSVFIFDTFLYAITHLDLLWTFGFGYNVANGLIPYKDFNMVIGPVCPYLLGLLMSIFGKNLFVYNLIFAIIVTSIYYFLKKYGTKTVAMSIIFIYINILFPGYNVLCLLLYYIIYNLEENKKSDYLIGILISILFFTKINAGVLLLIPTFILHYKNINKILKRIVGFLTASLVFLIILSLTNSLYQFIDYTILGLFDFGSKNLHIDTSIILLLIALLYLLINIIKYKKITNKYIYALVFLAFAYPLLELNHIFIAIIPTITIISNNLKKYFKTKYLTIIPILFLALIYTYNIIIIKNTDYTKNKDLTLYKYGYEHKHIVDFNKDLTQYFEKNYTDSKLFITSRFAYMFKISLNMPIDKYDLINNGNMGFNGIDKYINEIDNYCKENKCVFLLFMQEYNDNSKDNQTNKDITKYVLKNYNKREDLGYSYLIYDNTKICMFEK